MRIFSHMGIYDYGVVLFVLMGWYILRDWLFVSCGNFTYLFHMFQKRCVLWSKVEDCNLLSDILFGLVLKILTVVCVDYLFIIYPLAVRVVGHGKNRWNLVLPPHIQHAY
jgi:hypothetical protein